MSIVSISNITKKENGKQSLFPFQHFPTCACHLLEDELDSSSPRRHGLSYMKSWSFMTWMNDDLGHHDLERPEKTSHFVGIPPISAGKSLVIWLKDVERVDSVDSSHFLLGPTKKTLRAMSSCGVNSN